MTTIYSNLSYRAMQSGIPTLKLRMEKLQAEISAGRVSTPAMTLGSKSAPLFSLRQEFTLTQAYRDNVAAAKMTLSSAGIVFENLGNEAQKIRSRLSEFLSGITAREEVGTEARRILRHLNDTAGLGGGFANPLSGQSGLARPFQPYYAQPISNAQTDYQNAFSSTFGFGLDDAQAQELNKTQVENFAQRIVTSYASEQTWEQLWLAGPIISLDIAVSGEKKMRSPTAASVDGLRTFAATLVNLAELADSQLSAEAFAGAVASASSSLGKAEKSFIDTQSEIGRQISRLNDLDDRYKARQSHIEQALAKLEVVDQYVAITELNDLKSQLEVSYTITARVNNLFLFKYIS
jgi:flagellar hook-associated protein 3 FlgL